MQQKTTWTQLLLIGILSSCVIISCEVEEQVSHKQYDDFIYINNSSSDINIERWQMGNSNLFELKQSDTLFMTIVQNSNECLIDNETVTNFKCPLILADSLKIDYGNGVSKTFEYSDESDDNPYRPENLITIRKENGISYTFIFLDIK